MLNPATPHLHSLPCGCFWDGDTDNQLIFNCEANAVAVDEGSTKGKELATGQGLFARNCMMTLLKDKTR